MASLYKQLIEHLQSREDLTYVAEPFIERGPQGMRALLDKELPDSIDGNWIRCASRAHASGSTRVPSSWWPRGKARTAPRGSTTPSGVSGRRPRASSPQGTGRRTWCAATASRIKFPHGYYRDTVTAAVHEVLEEEQLMRQYQLEPPDAQEFAMFRRTKVIVLPDPQYLEDALHDRLPDGCHSEAAAYEALERYRPPK